jgi:hypothetical protein
MRAAPPRRPHRRVGAGGVGEAEVRRVHDPLPVAALPDPADEGLADARDAVDEERRRHLAVRVAPPGRDRRVEQHQPVDEVRVGCGEQQRNHPAHRVADEDRGLAHDVAEEGGQQRHVGCHGALPLATGRQPEPGEVDRIHPAVPTKEWPEQHPVQV